MYGSPRWSCRYFHNQSHGLIRVDVETYAINCARDGRWFARQDIANRATARKLHNKIANRKQRLARIMHQHALPENLSDFIQALK